IDAAMTVPDELAQEYHPLPGNDLAAEAALIAGAESDEAGPFDVFLRVEARQLGCGLDHQHAGEKRPAGNMPRHPELIGADILVANDRPFLLIRPNHSLQHFHIAAVRIHLADLLRAEENLVQIDPGDVKDELWGHENRPGRIKKPARRIYPH